MAESKKKTTVKKTTVKKAWTSSKKAEPKTTSKKSKKPSPQKSISATPKKVTSKKVSAPVKKSSFKKELIPEGQPSVVKNERDLSLFTTVLAIFLVALVVLWWYIYSRQSRMMEPPAPPIGALPVEPQRVSISSSVVLTPDVVAALEYLITQITIGSYELLQKVEQISNPSDSIFSVDAQSGDYIFYFKSASILYRPSVKQIIKTAPPGIAE
jgi:hypothetical protein